MRDTALQTQAFADRFGSNLARLRKAADLSQDELSYMAGLHHTEISQLERGLRVPRADTVVKLCACLEAEYAELFEGLVWQPPPQRQRGGFDLDEAR